MFKKLYKKIDEFKKAMDIGLALQTSEHQNTRSVINKLHGEYKSKMDSMSKTIASQQRTIEQLTNALMNKYENGLFVVSEDCKTLMVIRNGKEITTDRTTYFRITWAAGDAPIIETEQMVGTWSGEDN